MLGDAAIVYLFVYVDQLAVARDFYERTLGLRIIEEGSGAAKYDAGDIILALNRAADYGIALPGSRDGTSLLVFHCDDIESMRAGLLAQGVAVEAPLSYDIGATAAFYDPDGHCLELYQPSPEAMGWPSGDKIRDILRKSGLSSVTASSPQTSATSPAGAQAPVFGTQPMTYLFLFVRDLQEALEFYHVKLGLHILEEDPTSGVVKYDGGTVILATHLVGGDAWADPQLDMTRPKGIAPVFLVRDIRETLDGLSANGISFRAGIISSDVGATAIFSDPNEHTFFIYEPSALALSWPSGVKVSQLLARYPSTG